MTIITKQHHKQVHLQEEIQEQFFPRLPDNYVLEVQHGHVNLQRCEKSSSIEHTWVTVLGHSLSACPTSYTEKSLQPFTLVNRRAVSQDLYPIASL